MTYRDYLLSLRRGWWIVLLGLVLGGALSGLIIVTATPRYEATTQLFVSTSGSSDLATAVQGNEFTQQRMASYAQLLAGRDMAKEIIDRLDLAMSSDDLISEIEATAVPDTVLLDVVVTDPSPERALAIAEAVAPEFRDLVTDLETPEGATTSPVKVTVVTTPELPTSPSSPRVPRDLGIGLGLGLLAGVGAAVARARFDTAVRDTGAVTEAVDAPLIGAVICDSKLGETHVLSDDDTSAAAEGFRHIRTNLQFLQVDAPPRVILVSSALPDEGKSTVAANLALTLARAGRSVVLVEADLRRPRVARYLGRVSGVGLTNVLNGTAGLEDVLQPSGDDGPTFLAAGPTPPNPSELLSSAAMSDVVSRLLEQADMVLLDGAPLLPVADAVGLAPRVDGVLLCVRFGRTKREELSLAREVLDRVGAATLGAVVTFVPPRTAGSLSYSYGYGERPTEKPGIIRRVAGRFHRRRSSAGGRRLNLSATASSRPSLAKHRRQALGGPVIENPGEAQQGATEPDVSVGATGVDGRH
jgi:capsular exopolysaccharide synthesis family protein